MKYLTIALSLLITATAVAQQPANTIRILGEVKAAGVYRFASELRLTQAIAMAGGLTPYSDAKAIAITRSGGEMLTVNLQAVLTGSIPDVQIMDGDVIRVPVLKGKVRQRD